jgi:hypothetical protein
MKEMISILPLYIVHLYGAPFQQHLHMDFKSLSWNDVHLHELDIRYPLSSSCH